MATLATDSEAHGCDTAGRGASRARPRTALEAVLFGAFAIAAIVAFLVTFPGCAAPPPPAPPPPPRPVPAVVGFALFRAEEAIRGAGLESKVNYRYGEVDLDWVVDQRPAAGTEVRPPESIELTVVTRCPR